MGSALALLASAAAFVFVLLPLFRKQPTDTSQVERGELINQRDMALDSIRELDFDHDLGNLSEEDHQALRADSKRQAVAVLKQLQIEQYRVDDEIEQAVAALRSGTQPKR
jgi:hypothetical protein